MSNTNPTETDLVTIFDGLKCGQRVIISYSSCMSASRDGAAFKVGRRSYSKKYGVASITLLPCDGPAPGQRAQYKLYKRASGHVDMAHGGMAVMVKSVTPA